MNVGTSKVIYGLALVAALGACSEGPDDSRASEVAEDAAALSERIATALGDGLEKLTDEELERERLDSTWRRFVESNTPHPAQPGAFSPDTTESWTDISAEALLDSVHLPVGGDVEGPTVLAVQTLLDRALFSPGVLDGRWGKNTEKAVFWLQRREGLNPTGMVDSVTFARLSELAGSPARIVRGHTLSEADVEGPFLQLPEDVYERAALDCLCYETLEEKLAELFHSTPELLRQLNPGVALDGLRAGDVLQVPAIREPAPLRAGLPPRDPAAAESAGGGGVSGTSTGAGSRVARIVVSDGGHFVHALDQSGRILYHFPSTLGSKYAPSPSGSYTVRGVAWNPTWHYQPDLLTGVPDHEDDAVLPKGPNNAVGVVWMDLSVEHYGIHGTSAPETIGYATSHGCVRLTNWDAAFLAARVSGGTPVEFRDPDQAQRASPLGGR